MRYLTVSASALPAWSLVTFLAAVGRCVVVARGRCEVPLPPPDHGGGITVTVSLTHRSTRAATAASVA